MLSFSPDSPLVDCIAVSPNHEERRLGGRIEILLLHYTGMPSTAGALARLRSVEASVSAHYLITEHGAVVQLVPEARRAFHAGTSSWEGTTDINSRSIGIEIANPGHDAGCPDFPEAQIEATIALCRDIMLRRAIRADRVLGHSDVAPARKNDPGEKFPWKRLAAAGIGLWVEPCPIMPGPRLGAGDKGPEVAALQRDLVRYGYGASATGVFDAATGAVVTAFQRHFRPALVDGIADRSTTETLRAALAARETLSRKA
jgi:N-acetylmuramoyl-L-alanine amidase